MGMLLTRHYAKRTDTKKGGQTPPITNNNVNKSVDSVKTRKRVTK